MAFAITLLPGGERFDAQPDETVLAAAMRAGHLLPYSCRSGSCGSCRAFVSGQWHYRDGTEPLGLTDVEREQRMVLLCQAIAAGPLTVTAQPVAAPGELTVQTMPVRVAGADPLSADVFALFLRPPSVERLVYRAGQYVDLLLPDGRRRSYSLAGAPRYGGPLELHVRLRPGGALTRDAMRPGSLLRIEGPLGTFFLRDTDRPVLMLAGSTGFAPFKAMLEDLSETGTDRPVELWWGARDRDGLYHASLLDGWQRIYPWFRWHRVIGGHVHERMLEALGARVSEFDVYMAGPPPMVRAARESFAAAGVADDRMFFDPFEPAG